jgi:hypothetical protein
MRSPSKKSGYLKFEMIVYTQTYETMIACLFIDPSKFNATKTTLWRLLQFIVQTCIINFWHISCISELQRCEVKFAFDHDCHCKNKNNARLFGIVQATNVR